MGKKREDYIIKISGDFDINTFHRLKTLKKSIFGAIHNNKKRLIIDMGKVTYIDSSGIGLLFMAKEKIYKLNGEFFLYNIPEYINKIFNTVGINHFFTYYTKEDLA